jgi:hypothetical protein
MGNLLKTKEYSLAPGIRFIVDATLIGRDVLRVQREGLGFKILTTLAIPTTREVQFRTNTGRLFFFDGGGTVAEKVKIIYK